MPDIDPITERLQSAIRCCHPLLSHLDAIGNFRRVRGGRTVIQELENPTLAEPEKQPWYSGHDQLVDGYAPANNLHKDAVAEECFTAAEFPFRQAAMAVRAGEDLDDGIAKLAKMISQDISSGGKRHSIESLADLVSIRPTVGVVGGIGRDHWRFWRNLAVEDRSGANLPEVMIMMLKRLTIQEGANSAPRPPNLILMGSRDYDRLRATETDAHREQMADTAISIDHNLDDPIIENYAVLHSRIYFLHTKYFYWRFHENRNWVKLDPGRMRATSPPSEAPALYGWAGNLTLSCAYAQGVLYSFR